MKKLVLPAIIAVGVSTAYAEYVSPEEALSRLGANSRSVVSAKLHSVLNEVYVFENEAGFMFLPADDIAAPLLGYCDTYASEINPELQYMLDFYAREIEAARGAVRGVAKERPTRQPLATLMTTKWNQGSPFNNDCPYVGTKRSVTGCVATAFAQALKHFNYPVNGVGTHSYYWETGGETLEFDYENTTFDWDNMVDEYDSKSTYKQNQAVAKLMYACGVSVDMGYSPESSGAVSLNVVRALIENFGYDKGVYLDDRDFYELYDWEDLIYNEIAQGHPVCYSGVGDGGAHEFVVDGYSSEGFFHVNWGWGGVSDGYFLLSSMDPYTLGTGGGTGGFNSSQSAVIGMQLPQEGSSEKVVIRCYDGFGPSVASADMGTKIAFDGDYRNCGISTQKLTIAVKFEPLMGDGAPVYAPWPYSPSDLQMNYQFGDIEFTLPSKLDAGYYFMRPAYKVNGQGSWIDMPVQNSDKNIQYCKVSGSRLTFTDSEPTIVSVKSLSLNGEPEMGSLNFDMTVACHYGYLSGTLEMRVKSNHKVLLTQETARMHIQAGGEIKASITIDFSDLTPGEYTIEPYFDDAVCGDGLTFTIEQSGLIEIKNGDLQTNNQFYDLQGRCIRQPGRGLYIINGKKILMVRE